MHSLLPLSLGLALHLVTDLVLLGMYLVLSLLLVTQVNRDVLVCFVDRRNITALMDLLVLRLRFVLLGDLLDCRLLLVLLLFEELLDPFVEVLESEVLDVLIKEELAFDRHVVAVEVIAERFLFVRNKELVRQLFVAEVPDQDPVNVLVVLPDSVHVQLLETAVVVIHLEQGLERVA
jgi:hypothetical protein